ncbi:hypothetical protein FXO38_22749 [Capsicum annuum]|nr:hypothetical protein FXO38_22749 [Capsicum annuum]KAF3642558.1 hypothetical protein FXO37_22456 [Capsicum annuum]
MKNGQTQPKRSFYSPFRYPGVAIAQPQAVFKLLDCKSRYGNCHPPLCYRISELMLKLLQVAKFGDSNIHLSSWEDKKNPSESKFCNLLIPYTVLLVETMCILFLSGARIQLSHNNEFFPGTMDKIVTASGPIDDILKVVDLIHNKLQDEEVDLTIKNEEGSSKEVDDFFSDFANAVPEIDEVITFAVMLKKYLSILSKLSIYIYPGLVIALCILYLYVALFYSDLDYSAAGNNADWSSLFDVMCDASGIALGAVLGQCKEKLFQPISYGIDFMGPFVSSFENKYIFVAIDYVSKWVEAVALLNNERKSMTFFLKKYIFTRFDMPRAILGDGGSHFSNRVFGLNEELWAYRMTYKTPIGMSTYQLVFGKASYFLIDLDYKALWALNELNMNWGETSEARVTKLYELEDFRLKAYESSVLYNEKMKKWHET